MKTETDVVMKLCGACGRLLPTSEFYRRKMVADGLQPYCKPCYRRKYCSGKPKRRSVLKGEVHRRGIVAPPMNVELFNQFMRSGL